MAKHTIEQQITSESPKTTQVRQKDNRQYADNDVDTDAVVDADDDADEQITSDGDILATTQQAL